MHVIKLASALSCCFVASNAFVVKEPHSNYRTLSLSSETEESSTTNNEISDRETLQSEKYSNLIEWLKANDADINDKLVLRPSSRGGGYGAFVDGVVEKDDILFTVPRSACVTLDNVKNDPDCGETFVKLMEKAGPGGNTVAIAGYLAKEQLKHLYNIVEENDQVVELGPYLSTLPWERGINNQEHILFWTDDQVDEALKGAVCYGEAKALRGEVELAIRVMNSIIGKPVQIYRGEIEESSGFNFPWEAKKSQSNEPVEGLAEAVTGAFVCILTRSFQDGDEGSDEEKLVPLLDMLQHSDEPNIRHAMRKVDGTVEVKASRTIQPGEELFNQYRSEEEETMPYHRFFTRFGFIPGIMEPIQNLLEDKSSIFYPQKQEV